MEPDAPSTSSTRLSMPGVTGCPVIVAVCRVWISEDRMPSQIQSVRASGSPLSKTLLVLPDDEASTNGAHSRPGYAGSE